MIKSVILLFHFLMMTTALLSFPCWEESRHIFEDFICSSKMFMYEMPAMNLKKPMISFVFLSCPVSLLYIFFFLFSCLLFDMRTSFLEFLLMFLPGKANMTLLSKKRLKVISWYNLLLLRIKLIPTHWCTTIINLHLHCLLTLYWNQGQQSAHCKFIARYSLFWI